MGLTGRVEQTPSETTDSAAPDTTAPDSAPPRTLAPTSSPGATASPADPGPPADSVDHPGTPPATDTTVRTRTSPATDTAVSSGTSATTDTAVDSGTPATTDTAGDSGTPAGTDAAAGTGISAGSGAPPSTGETSLRGDSGITALPLPAHRDEWERRLLADPHLLGDIAHAIGGPFHVMYPGRVGRNIAGFRTVFERAGVDGAIYYGKKANKAACVVRACAEHGTGVDVASAGELVSALAHGVRGEDLMVTGPAKSSELLWLAARHRALIAVDEPGELDRLMALGIPARVLLRVLPPNSTSRFGMTGDELEATLARADLEAIRIEGFSFHLSGYDPIPRAELAAALLERCREARGFGHPATTLSIGGGFAVDYLPARHWAEFTEAVAPHWFHAGKAFGSYYPYHSAVAGPAVLAAVLAHDDLAERLRDNGVRLAIEPGRALLDRAGSTVFRVQGAKTRTDKAIPYQLLTVGGTSLSLSEQWFDSEYLPDPVLWPTRPGTTTPASVGAATCLESDMLSWRRIPLPRPAETGDLLVYPNTAGYQMDSNESEFHQLPIPPKVVLHEAPDGRFRWTLDAG